MKKAVHKLLEITEEDDEGTISNVDLETQKERIRRIIDYQKSLYFAAASSLSATGASCSSAVSSSKRSSLLGLMKDGSTSLRRLFDMEHTSLSTHFNEYSGSPITKPICLWGSDEDEGIQQMSPWTETVKTFRPTYGGSESHDLSGFASDHSRSEPENSIVQKDVSVTRGNKKNGMEINKQHNTRDPGFPMRQTRNEHRLLRTKSFKILPGFGMWRCRGFQLRLRLRRLRIIICGREF